ncbi:MAG: TrmB family transcriptional regulator [Bacteroidales bacterium]|nr:TrmB family transcriptional regulator [Bacteroidales bacterium]
MDMKASIYDNLSDLGFNFLESEVYLELLANEPMTAYRVAKNINKPTANVYKAVDSLSEKGAVLIEDNTKRKCKAVPPEEFINHMEKSLLTKTKNLKEQLKDVGKIYYDELGYSIESVSLVFERFETMMNQCKKIAVIDIFPEPLQRVKHIIERAIRRGVDVHIQVYEPIDIKGANISYTDAASESLKYWESQQLNLIIDGEQHLLTLMNNKLTSILQAKWSNNLYVSCLLLAGTIREQVVIQLMQKMHEPDFANLARGILENQKFFFNSEIPGVELLFKLYSRS